MLARRGSFTVIVRSLMIVNNFHVVSISVVPMKADSPLIVDPNAVLTVPVAVKLLQSVSREGEVAQAGG
jgi:hypothetical protein